MLSSLARGRREKNLGEYELSLPLSYLGRRGGEMEEIGAGYGEIRKV